MFAIPFEDTHRDKVGVILHKMYNNKELNYQYSIWGGNGWVGENNYVYRFSKKLNSPHISTYWLEFCLFKLAIDLGVKPEDVIKYWMLNKQHPVDYLYKIFEQKQLQ